MSEKTFIISFLKKGKLNNNEMLFFPPTRLAKTNDIIPRVSKVWGKIKPSKLFESKCAKCFKVLKMCKVFSTTIPLLEMYPKIIIRL